MDWLMRLLRGRTPQLDERLTAGQATLLLRLPLEAVNACLERIPLKLQRRWFRPDRMRLHLREPLLEASAAPAYYAALAARLGVESELELVELCRRRPRVVAEALLQLPMDTPPPLPPGWSNPNLATLRKPSKWTMLRHLMLLRRI